MVPVGFDTVSLRFGLDTAATRRASAVLPRERSSVKGGTHRYGNFDLWSGTLHSPGPYLFATSTLVLTASLPRLIYGENTRPVGGRLAAEAVGELCGRFKDFADVELAPSDATVCRTDCCATFAPFPNARPVIARLATVDLPRRERAAMGNGVTYFARSAKETVYDKQAEVARTLHLLTRRATADPATVAHVRALLCAERHFSSGALRVECRINGSRAIAKRLGVPVASPDAVLTTANAAFVVDAFLKQLRSRLVVPRASEAARVLRQRLGPVRGQRAFALLALAELTGSIEVAAATLGIAAVAADRLVSSARSAGVSAVDLHAQAKPALALPAISVPRMDRFERRLQHTWRRTPATSRPFSLSSAA